MSRQYTPQEAAKAVLDAARQKLEAELARLQKTEEVGKSLFGLALQTPSAAAVADGDAVHRPSKGVFKALAKRRVEKAETFINLHSESVPGGARYTEIGKPDGNLPGEKPTKRVGEPMETSKDSNKKSTSAEKTGGATLDKAMPDAGKPPQPPKAPQVAAPKPAGVPGAGKPAATAPGVPKPPAAPGMKGTTMKNEMTKGVFGHLKNMKKAY